MNATPSSTGDQRLGEPAPDSLEARVLLSEIREQMFQRRERPRVGRFELESLVGRGAHGSVCLAEDPQLRRRVAVKLLGGPSSGPAGRDRLLREAQTLARLNHPNVLTIHDVGVEGDRVFIAMEYVEATLAKWCRDNPPGTRARFYALLDLAVGMTRGLSAAHAAGITHRDIKPANILVGKDGRPRIADFGLARITAGQLDEDLAATMDESHVAASTSVVGTPAYMAPEQFTSRGDAASDQWSLCAALWEAAYGERPFEGADVETRSAALHGKPRAPPADRTEVPRWWREILTRGLSHEPSARWPSVAVLGSRLQRRARARPRRVVAIAAGSAIVAGAAVWGLAGPASSPCNGFDDGLGESWNDDNAAELERPVQRERVNDFVRSWRASARRTCLDLDASGDLDRGDPLASDHPAMSCLRQAGAEFEVLAAAIVAARGTHDGTLEPLTLALPDLDRCEHGPFDANDRLGDLGVAVAADLARAQTLVIQRELERAHDALDGVSLQLEQTRAPLLKSRLFLLRTMAHDRADDHAAAFTAAEAALAQAQLVGDGETTAYVWVHLSRAARLLGKIEEADFYTRQAEAIAADRELATPLLAAIARVRGGVHQARNETDAAIASFELAVQLSRETEGDDSGQVALSLASLAEAYDAAKRPQAAIEAFAKAAEINAAVYGESSVEAIGALANLAFEHEVAGQIPEALEAARAALSALEKTKGTMAAESRALLYMRSAALFASAGSRDEAVAALAKGRRLAEAFRPSSRPAILVHLTSGNVYLDLGDSARAIAQYEALPTDWPDRHPERTWAQASCVNLTVAYAREGRADDARRLAATCEARLGDSGNEVRQAVSRGYLAEAFETIGDLDRARRHYETAAALLERHEAHPVERPAIEAGLARTKARP